MGKDKYKRNKEGFIVLNPKDKMKARLNAVMSDLVLKDLDCIEIGIGDYVFDKGISHAINRNVGRDIPSIYDGFNRVERRMMYTMHVNKIYPWARRAKVQAIVGDAIEKFYPHGPTAAESTISRLGRVFSTMIPYIDKEGNFGNMHTKRPGSARYIEGRLSKYAYDCFFSETDVPNPIYDVMDNYKYDDVEPIYLPSKYPNCCMQWNSGIGNGISTMIPAFNSRDVFDATLKLIDDPKAKIDIYPDTPSPIKIINKDELKGCFDMHRFPIKMQAHYKTEVIKGYAGDRIVDKYYLIFYTLPINSNAASIEEQIRRIKKDEKNNTSKKFKEILNINVSSPDDGDKLEFYVEYEKGYDPDVLAEKIMKSTGFSDTISAQIILIKDNQPVRYTPRTMLLEWLAIRLDQKRRYIQQKILKVAMERVTTKAVLQVAEQGREEELVRFLRKSDDELEVRIVKVADKFGLTRLQSKYVCGARLDTFSGNTVKKLKDKLVELDKDYKYYKSICNEDSIKDLIKEELKEGKKKYAVDRRAELLNIDTTSKKDADEEKILVYNNSVYFCLDSFDKLPNIADKIDKSFDIVSLKNNESIMIFNKYGIVKVLDGYSFNYTDEGISLSLASLDNVVKMIKVSDKINNLAFITQKGIGKIMDIKEVIKSTKSRVINLADNDLLATVTAVKGSGIVGMITDDKLYYVKADQIPKLKKGSYGNKLIKGDVTVAGSIYIDNSIEYVLVYGESGYVKVMSTQYLSFSKKDDNYISLIGKNIYGILPLKDNVHELKLYDVEGMLPITLKVGDNKVSFVSELGEYKFPLSTSIGSPIKVLKKGKNDFYKIK